VLVLGSQEIASGKAQLKFLENGEQKEIHLHAIDDICHLLKR
jgi:DNA-binding Xre family transcriptional regulator